MSCGQGEGITQYKLTHSLSWGSSTYSSGRLRWAVGGPLAAIWEEL